LSRIDMAQCGQYLAGATHGLDLIIVPDGAVTLTAKGQRTLLGLDAIALAPFGTHFDLNASATAAMLFKASIPVRPNLFP
jgi:hypothetical protein